MMSNPKTTYTISQVCNRNETIANRMAGTFAEDEGFCMENSVTSASAGHLANAGDNISCVFVYKGLKGSLSIPCCERIQWINSNTIA